MQIITRKPHPRAQWQLETAGIHPLLAQLYAARNITNPTEVDPSLQYLLPPQQLKGATEAAQLLIEALEQQQKICIVADYDCDGATACAAAIRGLKLLGFNPEQLTYIVPNRFVDGYGLTPAIADRVKATNTDILMTVDNGISSFAGVDHARQLGMRVLITDHHLPANIDGRTQLPKAHVIVNPNQPDCPFESKALAGVGVVFYILIALRSELRQRNYFDAQQQPRLDALLDLVALGTVADVVKLDANNRRLVAQGLQRIRKGEMQPGVAAIFRTTLRAPEQATTSDIGFAVGPRLNAAGRLHDMSIGIECLLTDDHNRAMTLAQALDQINQERKEIESEMAEQSLALLDQYLDADSAFASTMAEPPAALTLYDPDFHEGVVGILASRLKEKFYRPTFVFTMAQSDSDELLIKGSGRSIEGFHLRDALDLIEKQHPNLLLKFGGHAMAAGCTLREADFEQFTAAFIDTANMLMDENTLQRRVEVDGALPPPFCTPEIALLLKQQVWGSGFPAPLFNGHFDVVSQRFVGEQQNHLSLKLRYHDNLVNAIWFRRATPIESPAHLVYRLDINEWQGNQNIQFIIEGIEGE